MHRVLLVRAPRTRHLSRIAHHHKVQTFRRMSTSNFDVQIHQVPCSHIREYVRALSTQDQPQLYLSVKQYTPKSNPHPQPGDITIIASQANAFPKELYEPLWDDLLNYSSNLNSTGKPPFRIRSIWMADVAHQGSSYALNEQHLGNDPSWFDHSRDLLNLVNQCRMPEPIFGVGHSMGGAQLMNLSLFNPRLFYGLVLLDPVIQPRTTESVRNEPKRNGGNMAALSTFRRDLWPSREAAKAGFAKSPFYQSWDERVLDNWVQFGLRDCPTLLHPDAKAPQVTLATPPAMEVYQFSRPNFEGYGMGTGKEVKVDRTTHSDLDPENPNTYPFYRSEPNRLFKRLEELRPSVLFVSGGASNVSQMITGLDQERLRRTGAGIGGSGGVDEGRVKLVTLDGVGHLVAMEDEGLKGTVKAVGEWLGVEAARWKQEQEALRKEWFDGRSPKEMQEFSEEWKRHMGGPPMRAKETRI